MRCTHPVLAGLLPAVALGALTSCRSPAPSASASARSYERAEAALRTGRVESAHAHYRAALAPAEESPGTADPAFFYLRLLWDFFLTYPEHAPLPPVDPKGSTIDPDAASAMRAHALFGAAATAPAAADPLFYRYQLAHFYMTYPQFDEAADAMALWQATLEELVTSRGLGDPAIGLLALLAGEALMADGKRAEAAIHFGEAVAFHSGREDNLGRSALRVATRRRDEALRLLDAPPPPSPLEQRIRAHRKTSPGDLAATNSPETRYGPARRSAAAAQQAAPVGGGTPPHGEAVPTLKAYQTR